MEDRRKGLREGHTGGMMDKPSSRVTSSRLKRSEKGKVISEKSLTKLRRKKKKKMTEPEEKRKKAGDSKGQ